MEYIRPENIRHVHPDRLWSMKDQLRAELQFVQSLLDGQVESICAMCAAYGYAYNDIPEEWAYFDDGQDTLICNNCIGKWPAAGLEFPPLTREIELR